MPIIKYPTEIITNRDKLEFLYSAQEKLRLEHNEMGRKFRDGEIDSWAWEQYKNKFSSKNYELSCQIAPIRDDVIEQILGEDIVITNKINQEKEKFKKSVRWDIDLNKIWQ